MPKYSNKLMNGLRKASDMLLYSVPYIGDYAMFSREDLVIPVHENLLKAVVTGTIRAGSLVGSYFSANKIDDSLLYILPFFVSNSIYAFSTLKIMTGIRKYKGEHNNIETSLANEF